LGSGAEVFVLEPVAVALEGEDLGVVDEAVDHRCGDDLVAEDLAPAGEGFVRGDDQAGAFERLETSENIRLAEPRSCGTSGFAGALAE